MFSCFSVRLAGIVKADTHPKMLKADDTHYTNKLLYATAKKKQHPLIKH